MAQTFLFPHLFANMEVTPRELEAFCRQVGLISGTKPYVFLKETDSRFYFDADSLTGVGADLIEGNKFHPVTRTLMKEEDLESLKVVQVRLRKFLDSCIEGSLPFLDVVEIFNDFQKKKYITLGPAAKSPWWCVVEFADCVRLGNVPLGDLINAFGILHPVLAKGESPIKFEWTKKCVSCGRYYQAKGPKAVFCGETCRSRARSALKEHSRPTE